jgi:replication factor A1
VGCLVIYTVRDLEDKVGGVSIRLRVLSKGEPRSVKTRDGQEHTVVDAVCGDRTGIVGLSLWDERIREVEEGDVIDIGNGYVSRFKGRLRLNAGKFGTLEKVNDPAFPSFEELSKIRGRRYPRQRTSGGRQF